jgi:methylated-DNA-[protein]-cysteine S-methyltransferase
MKFDNDMVRHSVATALGPITLAATPRGLAGVWFAGQRHLPDHAGWRIDGEHPVLQQAALQLQQYFRGQRTHFDLPLDLQGGTPFQQQVWQALLQLPFGATTSYGALCVRIGKPNAVRALGAAVGRNPVSIIVPCHRVMGADGSLTGYAGGIDRKIALLAIENGKPTARSPGRQHEAFSTA